jgi:CO/xanthine dehydrogenase FAD-binding subunit
MEEGVIPKLGAYYRPGDLAEALALLAQEPDCEVLAGGTDLLLEPEPRRTLLDITRLGLDRVELCGADLVIGATVTIQQLRESDLAAAWADGVLVGACLEFGTLQVRNMATVGGNVAHALPAADLVPALLALDAVVELARADGAGGVAARQVPLDGFATGPFRTALQPGEIITALCIPARTRAWRAQYRKLGRVMRDLAQVNCATALSLAAGRVLEARVVLGAVHPTVVRVRDAEAMLSGAAPTAADWAARVEQAVRSARDFVQPITDVRATREWRRHTCGVLLARCLRSLSDPRTAGRVPSLEDGPSYCAGLTAEVRS